MSQLTVPYFHSIWQMVFLLQGMHCLNQSDLNTLNIATFLNTVPMFECGSFYIFCFHCLFNHRQWAIEVTQFSCDYENLAPQGCLQYHFGNDGAGNVESFNFNAGNGIHLANQNQLICIRREANMCKICWTPAAVGDFQLSDATATMGHNGAVCGYGTDGLGAMGYDHVIIPQPENTMGTAGIGTSKFCGSTLVLGATAGMTGDLTAATVCSKSVPFNIRFVSDNSEAVTDINSQGFKLAYTESKC